ncbi:hypothetical protein [Mycoplasmopsis cynos]|uniref:hypothetical protein n=1 Tax=Mycoplasmopsis cynos TaxID=171284 RepID=UPI0022012316|nr:hypothetical protein [Mycoplasmopsis cynos]UWV83202.1 hypothetical protein NW067_03085 [Mycoplasmopsis cynos]
MKLKFKSIINQNNETKNIEFTVPVDIYEDDKFKSFAFYGKILIFEVWLRLMMQF